MDPSSSCGSTRAALEGPRRGGDEHAGPVVVHEQRRARQHHLRLARGPSSVTVANMFGLSSSSRIGERDPDLVAARVGLDHVGDEQHLAVQRAAGIGRERDLRVLARSDVSDILLGDQRRHPDDRQVLERHHRLRVVVDGRARSDAELRDAAGYRCADREQPRLAARILGPAHGAQVLARALVLGCRLRVAVPRLIESAVRRGADLELRLLVGEVLRSKPVGTLSLVIVGVGLGQVRGVDQCQQLAALHAAADVDPDLPYPPGPRGQHIDGARRIRFHHPRSGDDGALLLRSGRRDRQALP